MQYVRVLVRRAFLQEDLLSSRVDHPPTPTKEADATPVPAKSYHGLMFSRLAGTIDDLSSHVDGSVPDALGVALCSRCGAASPALVQIRDGDEPTGEHFGSRRQKHVEQLGCVLSSRTSVFSKPHNRQSTRSAVSVLQASSSYAGRCSGGCPHWEQAPHYTWSSYPCNHA